MALNRAVTQWRRSILLQANAQTRSLSSSSTRKFSTKTTADEHHDRNNRKAKYLTGEWAPVMVLGGFMAVVVAIAGHSLWQQMAYSPAVHLTKKKRESMPEVYNPDVVVGSADNFVNKSFLRKVGNIQEKRFHDPSIHDAYTRSREVESLKSVGIRSNN